MRDDVSFPCPNIEVHAEESAEAGSKKVEQRDTFLCLKHDRLAAEDVGLNLNVATGKKRGKPAALLLTRF